MGGHLESFCLFPFFDIHLPAFTGKRHGRDPSVSGGEFNYAAIVID